MRWTRLCTPLMALFSVVALSGCSGSSGGGGGGSDGQHSTGLYEAAGLSETTGGLGTGGAAPGSGAEWMAVLAIALVTLALCLWPLLTEWKGQARA